MKASCKVFIAISLFMAVMLGMPNDLHGMAFVGDENANSEVFVLSYREAVRAATLNIAAMLDIDDEIGGVEDRISDLREELGLLESGRWTSDRLGEIGAVLFDIDSRIMNAKIMQEQFMSYTELFLQQLHGSIVSIAEGGAGEGFGEFFLTAMQFFFNVQLLGGSIASMEHERGLVLEGLTILNEGQNVREKIRALRWNIGEFERQISNLRLQQEAMKLQREHSLRVGIAALAEFDKRIEIFGESAAIAELALLHLTARYELGRLSYNELREAMFEHERGLREFDELLLGRESALRNQNHLIGQPLGRNTTIEAYLEIPDFFDDLEAFVNRAVRGSIPVRQIETNLAKAREARREYDGNDRDTVNELRRAYEREVLRLDQARIAVEVAVLDNLSNLRALMNRKEMLKLELDHARFVLQTTLNNYELRRTTAYRVYAAELDIFILERNIEAILYQKWVLAFLIENPIMD